MVWKHGHCAWRWDWGLREQGSVSGNCGVIDCLHAAVSKDQKQAERILLHSDHVESICLHWKLHENKSKPRRMFSGPRSVTTLRLLPAERKGASHQNQKNQVPKPSRHTAKEWIFVSISWSFRAGMAFHMKLFSLSGGPVHRRPVKGLADVTGNSDPVLEVAPGGRF